jgi:hypothetical protein
MKAHMTPEFRRRLSGVLLGLAPLAAIHAMAKLAGGGPGTVVNVPLQYEQLQEMTDAMRELKLMIYGKHEEARPI